MRLSRQVGDTKVERDKSDCSALALCEEQQGSCDLFRDGYGRDRSYLSPKGSERAVEVAMANTFGAAALRSHCSACSQFRVP